MRRLLRCMCRGGARCRFPGGALRWRKLTRDIVLATEESVIQDGHVVLTEAPGLGVELNEDFLVSQTPDGEALWQ